MRHDDQNLQAAAASAVPLRIDIVSDVVCPWCAIGYRRLMQALAAFEGRVAAEVHWHPFELNPQMPAGGQHLQEHMAEKYGSTRAQSQAARDHLTQIGADLGVDFRYGEDSRIYNTFKAHQLLHWAGEAGAQTALKLALFDAYFTQQRDLDNPATLLDAAVTAGLDRAEAAAVLADGRYADTVRAVEARWAEVGVRGVPTFVFNDRYLATGAQPVEAFTGFLDSLLDGTLEGDAGHVTSPPVGA